MPATPRTDPATSDQFAANVKNLIAALQPLADPGRSADLLDAIARGAIPTVDDLLGDAKGILDQLTHKLPPLRFQDLREVTVCESVSRPVEVIDLADKDGNLDPAKTTAYLKCLLSTGDAGSTRTAPVWSTDFPPRELGPRTIVEPGAFRDCLAQHGLLTTAVERGQTCWTVLVWEGGYIGPYDLSMLSRNPAQGSAT